MLRYVQKARADKLHEALVRAIGFAESELPLTPAQRERLRRDRQICNNYAILKARLERLSRERA